MKARQDILNIEPHVSPYRQWGTGQHMQVEFQLPHDLARSPSPRPDATAQVGANAVKASQDILNTEPHVSPNWQWGTGLSTRQQGENITHDDADDY